jgi:hypothetical protein
MGPGGVWIGDHPIPSKPLPNCSCHSQETPRSCGRLPSTGHLVLSRWRRDRRAGNGILDREVSIWRNAPHRHPARKQLIWQPFRCRRSCTRRGCPAFRVSIDGKVPTQQVVTGDEEGGPLRYYAEVPRQAESTEAWLADIASLWCRKWGRSRPLGGRG